MNLEKLTTPLAIGGVILLATAAIFAYGTQGMDITSQAITGLLGFAGGVGTTIAATRIATEMKDETKDGEQ